MKTYQNPIAFKQALTNRAKTRAKERGMLFNRYLQLLLFDRFLARVYEACGDAVILKGGYALELRLEQARTTKDIDMRGTGDIEELIDRIAQGAGEEGSDFLTFVIGTDEDLKEMVGDQIVYEGRRIRIQARLAGKDFGGPFGLDLSMADALTLPPDTLAGDDLFEFVGIEPLQHRVYPKAAHVAEKLHAISQEFEDDRVNSRAKDLVDVGLLCSNFDFNAIELVDSIDATFALRDTHAIPPELPEPPPGWDILYDKIRRDDELPWENVNELHVFVASFLNPVLAVAGQWRCKDGQWVQKTTD